MLLGRAVCVTLRCSHFRAWLSCAVFRWPCRSVWCFPSLVPVLFERLDTCLTQLSQLHLRLCFCSVASFLDCQARQLSLQCVVMSGSTAHNSMHGFHGRGMWVPFNHSNLGPIGHLPTCMGFLLSGFWLKRPIGFKHGPTGFARISFPILALSSRLCSARTLSDAPFRKALMPDFRRDGHDTVTYQAFLDFGNHLPQADLLSYPFSRDKLCPDGWAWKEVKALSLSWFVGPGLVVSEIESAGMMPQSLLDACIAMIPKAEGNSTPLGQLPLSVLPVVYRMWISVRLGHIRSGSIHGVGP